MAAQNYFIKISFVHSTTNVETDYTFIASVDFATITNTSDLKTYLNSNSYLPAGAVASNIKFDDIQLIQGSGGGGGGLIAELIACTTNDELQSNNLIGAAVWSFGYGQDIRHINMQGITFNSVTGTIQDTDYNGYFVDGLTYVVFYNY